MASGRSRTGRQEVRLGVGYALAVDDRTHNLVRRLQLRLLAHCGGAIELEPHPHITLKQGFDVDGIEPFERYFDGLAEGVRPVDIRLCGVEFFDEGIAFLHVEPSDALTELRWKVLDDLSQRFGVRPQPLEDARYRFHATIATVRSAAALAVARRALSGENVDLRFECRSLTMLVGVPAAGPAGLRGDSATADRLGAGGAGGIREQWMSYKHLALVGAAAR